MGFALPVIFVSDDDEKQPDVAKDNIYRFIWVQSIVVTVLSIPVFFVIRNQPPTPPSRSAEKVRSKQDNSKDGEPNKLARVPSVKQNNF